MRLKFLTPKKIVNHVSNITPEFLSSRKINTILIDLDNTLTKWNSHEVDEEVCNWINQMKINGIRPCIVSNNKQSRIVVVAEKLDIPYVFRATKPRKRAFRNALVVMKATREQTAFIGDQLFTDILGANRMQLFSILVKPLHAREFFGTKIMRRVERMVMPHLKSEE